MGKRLPVLIHDDREKTPWIVPGFSTEVRRMPFGDYTVKGMEAVLRIERKNGWAEIASNLSTRKGRINIFKNIRKLSSVKGIAAIFVEDNPVSLPLVRMFSEFANYKTVIAFCHTCLVEYDVPVISIGKGGLRDEFVSGFFNRVITEHKSGKAWYKQ